MGGLLLAVVYDKASPVCYDNVHGHIVVFSRYVLSDQLEVISDPYLGGGCGSEKPVVISFSASDPVSATIVCDAGYYDKLYGAYVYGVVARWFFYMESSESHLGFFIRKYVKVHAVDPWKEEMLACAPFFKKLTGGKLVG